MRDTSSHLRVNIHHSIPLQLPVSTLSFRSPFHRLRVSLTSIQIEEKKRQVLPQLPDDVWAWDEHAVQGLLLENKTNYRLGDEDTRHVR